MNVRSIDKSFIFSIAWIYLFRKWISLSTSFL